MLPVIVQGSVSKHRHSCLCAQRRFFSAVSLFKFLLFVQIQRSATRRARGLGSLCSDQ
jgi:hypothetical protein